MARTTGQTPAGGLAGDYVSQYPGDQRLRNLGHELANTKRRLSRFGPVVHPGMSLRQALSTLDRSGGVVWFSEGIWFIREPFIVKRDNVVLRAVSPARTKLQRTAASSSPMLTFEGTRCHVIGFEIEDSPNSTSVCIQMQGNRSSVQDCHFINGYNGVGIRGANNCRVDNNHFEAMGNQAVLVTGTASRNQVNNNFFESSAIADYDIYFDDNATDGGAVGNNHEIDAAEKTISIKTGSGVVVDDSASSKFFNILDAASVQVRP